MPGTYAEILGTRIRSARTAAGMTQRDLGHVAGIQSHYISQVELGKTRVSVRIILAVADALGMDPAELVQRLLPPGRRRRGHRRGLATRLGAGREPGAGTYAEVLGARVRSARTVAGMTQRDLGRIARLQPDYIWRIESGQTDLSVRALVSIACALGMDPGELVQGLLPDSGRRRPPPSDEAPDGGGPEPGGEADDRP